LDNPSTAITATTDSFAAGLIQAARERGVRVPEQLSVTGFGDQSFAAYVEPPITTVHTDQRAIGEAGAFLLLQLLEGGSASTQVLVRPTLVERRSCAAMQRTERQKS
jgi:LacI family transcriptional regulator